MVWSEALPGIAQGHDAMVRSYQAAGENAYPGRLAKVEALRGGARAVSRAIQAWRDAPGLATLEDAFATLGNYCRALGALQHATDWGAVSATEIDMAGLRDTPLARRIAHLLPDIASVQSCHGTRPPDRPLTQGESEALYRELHTVWRRVGIDIDDGLASARSKWAQAEATTLRLSALAALELGRAGLSAAFGSYFSQPDGAREAELLSAVAYLCESADELERLGGPFASTLFPMQLASFLAGVGALGTTLDKGGRAGRCPRRPWGP